MQCYRRTSSSTWTLAPLWERHALEHYQEIQQDRRMRRVGMVLICTTRPDGSMFMAYFQEKMAGVYTFVLEAGLSEAEEAGEGEEVEMMWAPSRP